MKAKFLEENLFYNGEQLKSLFAYTKHGLMGDSIVSWVGGCDVPFEHMVDGEDLLAEEKIAGDKMLHFIIEKFGEGLAFGVAFQRLFAAIVMEELKSPKIHREGDDLYLNGDQKLSISIATVSPVSAMIHFAINVTNEGTPVKTGSLEELSIEPKEFAEKVMKRASEEMATLVEATQKVFWVK